MRPLVPAVALLSVAALLITGCGVPPELQETRDPPALGAPPASPQPGLPSPASPGGPGTPLGPGAFPEEIAIDCAGQPAGEELLALLRSEGILDTGANAEVVEGPFCSGRWQYAMITVPERDPLLLVSRGEPGALELMAAGTDVCTVEVRVQAPAGIRGAATCD